MVQCMMERCIDCNKQNQKATTRKPLHASALSQQRGVLIVLDNERVHVPRSDRVLQRVHRMLGHIVPNLQLDGYRAMDVAAELLRSLELTCALEHCVKIRVVLTTLAQLLQRQYRSGCMSLESRTLRDREGQVLCHARSHSCSTSVTFIVPCVQRALAHTKHICIGVTSMRQSTRTHPQPCSADLLQVSQRTLCGGALRLQFLQLSVEVATLR